MTIDSDVVLTERVFDNATVLLTKGSINSGNAKQFGEKLTGVFEAGCKYLIVDLAELEYMTSAGFRALLVAGKTAAKAKRKFALCGLNEDVQRLFELGGFLDLFPIHADSAAALEAEN